MKKKKAKIESLLKKAEYELKGYRRNHHFTNLSQACEKTWVAFTLVLELISRKELKNHKVIREEAQRQGVSELYHITSKLHIIHYEGSPALVDEDVISDITTAIKLIRHILIGWMD